MNKLKKIQNYFNLTIIVFLFGGGPDSSKFDVQFKAKNFLDSGIRCDKTSEVVYYWSSDGRDGDYELWVLYSKNKFNVPASGDINPDFKLSLSIIKQAISSSSRDKYKEIRNPKSCIRYDWEQNKAEYRGFCIEADNGYFLYLERLGKK